jgi:hypothetical protein
MALAALLMVVGAAMIVILLWAFMAHNHSWSLVSKEATETTAATSSAGAKKSATTEYSDSVLVAGMGLGALFLLSGAFFGRIREITLPGGISMKVGDLPPEKEEELKDAIAEKAKTKAASQPGVASEKLQEEAAKQAALVFRDQYWGAIPQPSKRDLNNIAEEAVERAGKVLADT